MKKQRAKCMILMAMWLSLYTLHYKRIDYFQRVGVGLMLRWGDYDRTWEKRNAFHIYGRDRLLWLLRRKNAGFLKQTWGYKNANTPWVSIQSLHFRFTRPYILRWLQGVHYDFSKGIKAMQEHFAWRKVNVPK